MAVIGKFYGISLLLIVLTLNLTAQDIWNKPVRLYRMGDWISYKNCNYPTSLTEGNEYYYFGTSGGVVPFQKYSRRWEEPYTTSDGMAGDSVTAVYFDKTTSYLWAAHEAGISYLTPTADRWVNYINPQWRIDRFGADNNSLWAKTIDGAYHRISRLGGDLQPSEFQLPEDVIWAPSNLDPLPNFGLYAINADLQFDMKGVIFDQDFREFPICLFHSTIGKDVYGGAWGLGMITGDDNVKRLNVTPMGPLQNSITSLMLTDSGIWMSNSIPDGNRVSNRTGISFLNFSDWTWKYNETYLVQELATTQVFDINYRNRRLWIGTDMGLVIHDMEKDQWKRMGMTKGLSDEIVTTIGLEDSLAWIGTPHGLTLISLPGFKTRRVNLSPSKIPVRIQKIVVGKDFIWLGTDNGIYSVDKKNHFVRHFDAFGDEVELNELISGNFSGIAVSDSVVIFSRQNILVKYAPFLDEWDILQYSHEQEVVTIFDMAIEDGYLWLGTDFGALLIRLSDNYLERYTTVDGLAGNHVYKINIDGEWVWFGTDRGLTQYHWRLYASKN
ncbi:MAG: hypothetical protein COT43_12110 [Candidatus Marinimicrobia bacterium CG08_land_8_20_14_0_20_45_22]|nr:MAG: hypothetical protein COT43_12110 [Candidatus Marinimicrobia bacterium CG08_land_8_20_14_0_20_45_22]